MDILTDSRQGVALSCRILVGDGAESDCEKLRIVEESFSGPRLVSADSTASWD